MGKIHVDERESQLIRSVFLVSVLSLFVQNLAGYAGQLVDGAVISKFLGASAKAAFQLSMPYSMVLMTISQLFSVGIQSFCARKLGAGEKETATSAYTTSVFLLTAISALAAVVGLFLAEPISVLLGASGEHANLLSDLKQYIIGFSFSTPMLCLTPVMVSVLFLEGRGRTVIRSLLIQTLVNIILVFANVFVFHQGMLGMSAL